MKLITNPDDLALEFGRLMHQHKHYRWAVAWASISSPHFIELLSEQKRIGQIVVGLHFYQTHPDFIEKLMNHPNVKFIKQPSGTFHPKLYLFYSDSNNWELISGSANFTNDAFTRNTEACILINSSDANSGSILKSAVELIEQNWSAAEKFSTKELDDYRLVWRNHRAKLDSLSGKYGGVKTVVKPIFKIVEANYSWSDFVSKVKMERNEYTKDRLALLDVAKASFQGVPHFNQLTEDERKFIAGMPNKLKTGKPIDWGWFGSMKGAGIFKNRIKENDKNISFALDQIPLSGEVTKSEYDSYIKYYTKPFSGNYLATATRLLAMKRPDTFVCLDSKNRSELCRAFGIVQSGMTYDRYWSDIVERVRDFEWYVNPKPKNAFERKLVESRAAFLDAIYYER